MAQRINKARYWWGVLYPENMVEGWEDKIGDILQVPFAYAKHSSDTDTKSETRKNHIHLIIVFPNTTTYKHALSVFSLLSAPKKTAINKCEACVNIRHCYDYLIHDTETCRKEEKHLYDPSERITGNCFDIGAYEQLTQADKREMLFELCEFIRKRKFCNFIDFYEAVGVNFDFAYFDIITGYSSLLERLIKGNYHKYVERKPIKITPDLPEEESTEEA